MNFKDLVAWTAICLAAVPAATDSYFTSHAHSLCSGIMEDNDMRIPAGAKFGGGRSGITQAQFNSVLDKLEAIYAPVIQARGGKLKVVRKWGDPTVNAAATQEEDGSWAIHMFGGLARHHAITEDGFVLVACHEIGHHLGGAPKNTFFGFQLWSSNEGQADYFATLKCLRVYFDDQSNAEWYAKNSTEIPQKAIDQCASVKANDSDTLFCVRSSMAGLSVATLFMYGKNPGPKMPEFETPDTAQVARTYHDHSKPQCRLDTYVAGALCDKEVSEKLSNNNPAPGTCMQAAGYKFGYRPRCWFKP